MRILLAEDEGELSKALCAILRHNNYSVDAVYNGYDALDYGRTPNYDGIILDIMMPRMDGITVLKQLRAKDVTTPIMLLTAKSELDDRVLGLDTGSDDCLSKPFAMKELLARVRAITRRKSEFSPSVIELKNIKLNRSNFELTNGETSFRLVNKEFQVMGMLMNASGRWISAERFMGRIWGFDTESESNVVWGVHFLFAKKINRIKRRRRNQNAARRRLPFGGAVMIERLQRRFVVIAMASLMLITLRSCVHSLPNLRSRKWR